MTATVATLVTTEELLALPNNGVDRWLIHGQLREKPITVRNRTHSRILIRLAYLLECWLERQPVPRGLFLGGEVGCRLTRDPDTTVGIDIAYISADLVQRQTQDTTLIDGIPVLAIEILSPSDRLEEINEKIDEYLRVGIALVWIVDPHDQTVTIYRPGTEPQLVNIRQELIGDPHLPGFRVPVAEIFA